MTLSGVYGFWKFVSNLERRETKRYLEMFYTLKYRDLVSSHKKIASSFLSLSLIFMVSSFRPSLCLWLLMVNPKSTVHSLVLVFMLYG